MANFTTDENGLSKEVDSAELFKQFSVGRIIEEAVKTGAGTLDSGTVTAILGKVLGKKGRLDPKPRPAPIGRLDVETPLTESEPIGSEPVAVTPDSELMIGNIVGRIVVEKAQAVDLPETPA